MGMYDPLVPKDIKLVPDGASVTNWSQADRVPLGGELMPGDVNRKEAPAQKETTEKQTYEAIKRGYRSPDDISISTGRSESEIKTAISQLVRQGLVKGVAPDTYVATVKSSGAKYIPTGDLNGSNL